MKLTINGVALEATKEKLTFMEGTIKIVLQEPPKKSYEAIHEPAWKAYQEIQEPAWKAYEAKERDIIANYKKLIKDAKEQKWITNTYLPKTKK